MNVTQILTPDEVQTVLASLSSRPLQLTIFRLSCCCGLRRKEIAGLDLCDARFSGPRPHIKVRKEITKGRAGKKRDRIVPLWWDAGTRQDLQRWQAFRLEQTGGDASQPFVCSLRNGHLGKRLALKKVNGYWDRAIKALGPDRALSIHCGRRTFCSHALAAGRSLAEVRDAAGHHNVSVTDTYLYALDSGAGDIF